MVKEVVNEIYQRSPLRSPADLFSALGIKEKPEFVNPDAARQLGIKSVRNLLKLSELIIKSAIKADDKTYQKSVWSFDVHRDNVMAFFSMWAQRIYEKNPESKNEIDRHLSDIMTHMGQIAAQGSKVIDSSTKPNEFGKPNFINAIKEVQHLREITANAEASVNELFNLAEKVGAK